MRRAPAAAAPIPVLLLCRAIALSPRSVWGHLLRNALLRLQRAYISLAASPPDQARRMTEPLAAALRALECEEAGGRLPGVKIVRPRCAPGAAS